MLSVHPGELQPGSGRILNIGDQTKTVAQNLTETLGNMASAAGHPDLASALSKVGASAMKAAMDTAAGIEYLGNQAATAAKQFDQTDEQAKKHVDNAAGGAR
ncbi:type VII secretion target [Amycolatopsis alkalitolerans]|uniref:ESX-1 secretion-associated protein n=1 Tax=Amycolatopsis alkalitolerans TaxID=2547244 RepID=A0A5C4M413_9PSEU|nr:type VII secretion target [Amycolatopsis alkalitolerans]TNC26029.1 hypothetical protein FG385_12675 [Amycolatopsis alkalitolerans]